MAKRSFFASVAAGTLLLALFSPSTFAQTVTICPLGAKPGRILLKFRGHLRADQAENAAVGPISTEIPLGHYQVTLVSFDHHTTKPPSKQGHEQWFLQLRNSQGKKIADTPAIGDLAEDKDYLTQVVASRFHIPATVKSVLAHHLIYPNVEPNSIYPVCAAFDPVSADATPTPTPTPSSTVNPTKTPTVRAATTRPPTVRGTTSPPTPTIIVSPNVSPSPTATLSLNPADPSAVPYVAITPPTSKKHYIIPAILVIAAVAATATLVWLRTRRG